MISAIKSCFRCLRKHGARAANSRLTSRILERNGFVENEGVGRLENSGFRASQARRKKHRQNCPRLLQRNLNTYNTRTCARGLYDSLGRKAYDSLILNGYDHYRVFHSENDFARGKCHVNGIENFWSFAKRRLQKFNGCDSDKFISTLDGMPVALQPPQRRFIQGAD